MSDPLTRRSAISLLGSAIVASALRVEPAWAALGSRGEHPEPRPGIDASRVLTAEQLHVPHAAEVFDLVREIPQIVDGIRCHCGCATIPGNYSLLSCYEGTGMAQHCHICQGEGRLAHRLHRDGWSLNGIRAAIDARFTGT